MFESIEHNKKMIVGAYKKLKSYFYYDKTILYNKVSLSTWEADPDSFDLRVDSLAKFMCSLENSVDYQYLAPLYRRISLVPMPKSFENDSSQNNLGEFIQNTVPQNSTLSKVNFYIKAPVEILILDTIWMLMIGKIAHEQHAISTSAYANKPKADQIFYSDTDLFSGIDFDSNRLLIPYFQQYTSWRNKAFKTIESRYRNKQDSVLISLDLKSYYYSVSFDFNDLPEYLNHDIRLAQIEPLTKIVRQVYIDYTSEMKKYRGSIPAECDKGQSALPIGLHSSMLLANLYLREFDLAIESRISPAYYGRYVDDILIVTDKPSDFEMSVTSILHETLVRKEIIKPKNEKEYSVLFPRKAPHCLTLQSEKIRCIYFNHNEPDALIKILCEASNIKASMSEGMLMPDVDFSERSFDEQAYSLGERSGALKVRNFLFSSNNYEAILFVNDLIRTSKNVDIHESEHRKYIDEQLNQILKFYKARQSIEYRSAWINVFSLILINERYDCFLAFYEQIKQAIEDVQAVAIESIEHTKTIIIADYVKESLLEQLKIAVSIAISPLAIEKAKERIAELANRQGMILDENDWHDIFSNAKDIRNANMFNNHFSAFPLISYIEEQADEGISLISAQPQLIAQLSQNSKQFIPLNERKIQLCPRFIHFDELCQLGFLAHYYEGGNPVLSHLDALSQTFIAINGLKDSLPTLEENSSVSNGILLHKICAPNNIRYPNKGKIKIALASVLLDEEKDIEPVLKNPVHDLSPAKKRALYKMLNEAQRNHADMIVFPEYYLPIHWIEELYAFSRKNSISIVCGLRYITNESRAYNYMTVLQPFKPNRFNYALPLFREKNHYAPAEVIALARNQFECVDPSQPSIHLIDWKSMKFSDLMCFELTNIEYRYVLRNKIDVLIVPELNKDTSYFSNIVESASRDLHCFVVQANTSKYGDSRITGPYNSLFKDIIKVKGGENNVLLIGTIDCFEVQEKRGKYPNELLENKKAVWAIKEPPHEEKPIMKGPPAGFYGRKEEQ